MKTKIFIFLFSAFIQSCLLAQSGWFPVYGDTNAAWQWNFFSDVNSGYAVGYRGIGGLAYPRIIKTTNAGSSWFEQISPERDSANFYFRCVFFTNTLTGFISAANSTSPNIGRILKTTNGGTNWNIVSLPVNKQITNIYFVNSSTGYASGYQTMLKTTDAGANWVYQSPYFYYLFAIDFTSSSTGYVVGNIGAILKTSDGGDNWIPLNSGTSSHLWGLDFIDDNTGVAVGGNANNSQNIILRTTNAGNNWSVIPYTNSTCLLWSVRFTSPATGYIIGWCSQVLKSTNGGLNWYNQLVPENNYWGRSCFFTDANTGYLAGEYDISGTQGYIYKTTNGGGQFVGVSPANEVPAGFHLHQNYPNPFNPSTKIKFDIPLPKGVSEGHGVSAVLKVYDALGKEVVALINKQLNPGTYEVEWDASNYPSGVYYYKFTAGDYTETRKMVLVK